MQACRRAPSPTRSTVAPGSPNDTRERILAIARDLGWYPNRAARALSAERADACGLVLARPAQDARPRAVLHGVHRGRRVRALRAVDRADDPARRGASRRKSRSTAAGGVSDESTGFWSSTSGSTTLASTSSTPIGLPAVVVGGPVPDAALPSVSHDEASVVVEAVRYLAALGHTRIGPRLRREPTFVHTGAAHRGLPQRRPTTSASGPRCSRPTTRPRAPPVRPGGSCRRPPSRPRRSSTTATCSPSRAWGWRSTGFSVPDDLSIVGWDDSLISQVVHPPLTAITRDIQAYGVVALRSTCWPVVEGRAIDDVETRRGELTPRGQHRPPRRPGPPRRRGVPQSPPGPRLLVPPPLAGICIYPVDTEPDK